MFKNAAAQVKAPSQVDTARDDVFELKLADRIGGLTAPVPAVDEEPELSTATIIAKQITVTGSLVSEGDISVSGTIQGDLACRKLIVREGGRIRGGVVADEVIISGSVIGPIRGSRVKLQPKARVESDIVYAFLVMEKGAQFEGSSRHSTKPKSADAPPAPSPVALSRPALVTGPADARQALKLAG